MQSPKGAMIRSRGCLALIITLLILCLVIGPTQGFCNDTGVFSANSGGDKVFWASMGFFSLLGAAAIGYTIYELNRPDQPRLLDGEFYGGAYLGASFAPSQNLNYNGDASFNNGISSINVGKFTINNNKFDAGVAGGIKLGYFFKNCPYLGLEGESGVSPNNVSGQTRSVSPAVLGSTQVTVPGTSWLNWITALHIVGRVGFLKDSEVPFGRLQPYVGIGPAVDVIYDPNDSAKNFALDVMGGVRYMFMKNLSAFVEYKYNHQVSPELESHPVQVNNFTGIGIATIAPYDLHRVVFGLTYHW